MRIDCLSIFPELLQHALGFGVIRKAQENDRVTIVQHDIRSYTKDKHQRVDDIPYGGGAGMVFKPEPVVEALRAVSTEKSIIIHPAPAAPTFNQDVAQELSTCEHLIFIASRYEGLDHRVVQHFVHREYSLGDYILSGGELAVSVMIDAIVRLVPGVLGNPESSITESFCDGLLEHPHYTRPSKFEGHNVPDVLLNGNHALIRLWRKRESIRKTMKFRPDLLKDRELDDETQKMLKELRTGDD